MRRALGRRVAVARSFAIAALIAVLNSFGGAPAFADHDHGRHDGWRKHERREHHQRASREREWERHRPYAYHGAPDYYVAPGDVYPPLVAQYPPSVYYPPAVYHSPPVDYAPPIAANSIPLPSGSPSPESCHQAQHTVTIDGKPEVLTGTVCKGPDGDWHVVP